MRKIIKSILLTVILISFNCSYDTHTAEANDYKKVMKKLNKTNGCLAINYHRIRKDNLLDKLILILTNSKEMTLYSITDKEFESEIKWLSKKGATFVSADELFKAKEKNKFPKKCVFINFDDMDISSYESAHPILKKYDAKATGFIISSAVGNEDFNNLHITSRNQLQEMYNSGLWTFGSHTHNLHELEGNNSIFLTEKNKIIKDLQKSKKYLDKNFTGSNHQYFAFPYGQYDKEAIKKLKQSNFKYAFTLEEDIITHKSKNYELPRILVNHDGFDRIVKKWKGFEPNE